jgi:hypothetical protein
MPDNELIMPQPTNVVQDWAQKNPWTALIAFIITTLIFSTSSSFFTTKVVAQKDNQTISTDNFATKQDKEEIWRFMNGRIQFNDSRFNDIRNNMATKDEVASVRNEVKAISDKNDTQIKMLQDQNKLLQDFMQYVKK